MQKARFFFCYDKSLTEYLLSKNVHYITKAIHPTSKKMFALFQQSEELSIRMNEYKRSN
jgi:hypothetical protein